MSLSHALLGLLAVKPASGYELAKVFEQDLGRYAWQASHTSIYPELGRLTERGLVEVASEGARGSRTYALTDAGREELRRWLLSPPGQAKVRNEAVLRMFLLPTLGTDDMLAVLRRTAEQTGAEASRLRAIGEAHPDLPLTGPEGFGLLAAAFGQRQYEAVHEWACWAIARLEAEAGDGSRDLAADR